MYKPWSHLDEQGKSHCTELALAISCGLWFDYTPFRRADTLPSYNKLFAVFKQSPRLKRKLTFSKELTPRRPLHGKGNFWALLFVPWTSPLFPISLGGVVLALPIPSWWNSLCPRCSMCKWLRAPWGTASASFPACPQALHTAQNLGEHQLPVPSSLAHPMLSSHRSSPVSAW